MSSITSLSVSSNGLIKFRWEGTGGETLINPQTVPAALTVLQGSTVTGPGVVPNPNVAPPFTLGPPPAPSWIVGQFSELVAGSEYEVVLTPPAGPNFTFQTGQVVTIAFTLQTTPATPAFTATAIVDAPYGQVINSITAAAAPVQQDLSYMTGFPFQVYDSYAMPSGGGGGATAAPTAKAMVDAQMKAVLGRSTGTGGVSGTLAALDRSFQQVQSEGVDMWVWQPQSYAVQSNTGAGVTGEQASLAGLAASVGDEILPLISGLTPLVPEATVNPDEIKAWKAIIASSWPAFANELGTDAGPRITRAASLLEDSATALAALGILFAMYASGTSLSNIGAARFGRKYKFLFTGSPFSPGAPADGWPVPNRASGVVTADDETNYTNFVIASDRMQMVIGEFQTLYNLGGAVPAQEDRGYLVTLLQRALEATGEAADAVYAALDSVNLRRDERAVIYVPGTDPSATAAPPYAGTLSVEDIISWAAAFPAQEGAALLQDAGNIGISSIESRATDIQDAVTKLIAFAPAAAAQWPGLAHPRVMYALNILAAEVTNVTSYASNPSLQYASPTTP